MVEISDAPTSAQIVDVSTRIVFVDIHVCTFCLIDCLALEPDTSMRDCPVVTFEKKRNPYNRQHFLNEYKRHDDVYSEKKTKGSIAFPSLAMRSVRDIDAVSQGSNPRVRRPSCCDRKVNPSPSPFSCSSHPH